MALLWRHVGTTWTLLWCRFGARYFGATVVLTLVLLRRYFSAILVLLWRYFGATLTLFWCYRGVTLALLWCYFGATLVLLWCYYGTTLALLWWLRYVLRNAQV